MTRPVETVILCGGKGTRIGPSEIPKPLLAVGRMPLLWHIMKLYASAGHTRFVLCLGHLAEKFDEYFAHHDDEKEGWDVVLADTGVETPTGGRVKRVEPLVAGDVFFATYGDGVADVDLAALLSFHEGHGRLATVTTVRPAINFGIMRVDDDGRVRSFEEKPPLREWVNGGFFVFSRGVFDYLREDSVLEREPFEQLVADGELMAYRHEGFWSCMDTYKDNLLLNEIWERGAPPWKTWSDA